MTDSTDYIQRMTPQQQLVKAAKQAHSEFLQNEQLRTQNLPRGYRQGVVNGAGKVTNGTSNPS